ncbi:hypothetical protein GobsT_71130 [Gemmata obscuriglobus]|uniref:SWIM-type domain-containing protein n=1 Tax=Gemmata obscuriglobus TaxID=114 RepID=A0A2Z3HJY8_9BACT|nr:hypothetical protein [Gemmata obscuriglobus]AWM41780.1 hypothetical protein C1280_35485 [Gemmata obscuriglobus]QEG32260.1 hypothetical protein GobsT_71130 [Gemmata obscuriglobus]VTS11616.1 hypothetical protein : [Gemmata obscuriglobus UQM 2246]
MTVYTELLEPTKSEKHGSIIWTPAGEEYGHRAGTLTISGTKSFAVYDVDEFPCDEGRGFMLLKKTPGTDATEDHYSVHVGSDRSMRCECRGFYSHHHCKHVSAIFELLKAKQL